MPRSVTCVAAAQQPCDATSTLVRGAKFQLRGVRLDQAERLVFEGQRGRADDANAAPMHQRARHLEAIVPADAQSGPLSVVDELGRQSGEVRVRVEDPLPLDVAPDSKFFFDGRRRPSFSFTASQPGPIQVEVINQADGAVAAVLDWEAQAGENTVTWDGLIGKRSAPAGAYGFRLSGASAAAVSAAAATEAFGLYDHVFPIRGRHNLGYTRTNQFGGGRGHQGIDMFAECGVDLAAARGGRVQYAGYHARAGNYAVIDGRGTGVDYTYMHMNAAPLVKTGDRVFTGQKIGEVGESGNADGCHLHFEMWDAPGWYQGGSAFDPRPALAGWDRYS
jgi:murein DD-endopeptidase MepM/ murein hydrolase activator NlpD